MEKTTYFDWSRGSVYSWYRLPSGHFKDPKGLCCTFRIATVETEDIKQLNTLPGLSEDPSVVGHLRVEEQQVPIAAKTMHH